MEDWQLLQAYVAQNSETAFRTFVTRYVNQVYAVALRQVRNAQLAEEVVQAVFILLARKAPSLPGSTVLPGWLYRTTRFVGARALRAEQRRHKRDQEAFHMQQNSSTDDTWRRLTPILDEALEQLGDVDRNALILRFFQEKPLQEVGRSLGLTEEAARKRVARSLEKLRGFFARRGFTVTTAVLSVALAKHSAEAAPAVLVSAVVSTAFAHAAPSTANLPLLVKATLNAWRWAKVRMALGLGAAGVLLGVVALNGLTRTPQPAPAVLVAGAAHSQPQVPSLASSTNDSGPLVEVPVSGNLGSFAFQAVDAETTKGVAGARVFAVTVRDREHVDLRTNLVTDSQGRCEVPLVLSNVLFLAVGALADGYQERCVVAGYREAIPAGYVLKLPRGSRIGGVVQDESGNPLAGVNIYVQFYGTGDASVREFQRERPGFPADDLPVARTDDSGHWTFGSASATKGDFSIEAKHPEYPKKSFRTDRDEHGSRDADRLKFEELQAGSAILVLKRGLSLRGVVLDEQQTPIAAAKVSFGDFSESTNPQVQTAEDGTFSLNGLPAGQGHITITAQEFGPERIAVEIGADIQPLTIALKPGGSLRLRVIEEDGSEVAHARVQLQSWRGPNTLEWGGYTGDNGQIEWGSAPRDQMDIFVGKEGFFYSRNNLVIADGQEHTITLHRQLIVCGLVTDSETKQPVASFEAIPGSGSEYWERLNLAHGTNGLYRLPLDEYRPPFLVRFEAKGYAPSISAALDPSVTNVTCNIELKRQDFGDTIRGLVLLPDARQVAKAQVALLSRDKTVTLGRARFINLDDANVADTDAEGRFSFPPNSAAYAVAAVDEHGFARVDLDKTNHTITIQLEQWGRIEGSLKLRSQTNAGQQICFFSPQRGFNEGHLALDPGAFSTKTDTGGNFVFEEVPVGDFDLFLVPGLGIPFSHQTPVHIEAGATLRVQIGRTGCSITGRFVLSNPGRTVNWRKQVQFPTIHTKLPPPRMPEGLSSKEVQEFQMTFWQSEEGRAQLRAIRSFPLEIQPDGSFMIDDVPPGRYELNAQLLDSPFDPSTPTVQGATIGSIRQEITVPESATGQANETLDLGNLVMTLL